MVELAKSMLALLGLLSYGVAKNKEPRNDDLAILNRTDDRSNGSACLLLELQQFYAAILDGCWLEARYLGLPSVETKSRWDKATPEADSPDRCLGLRNLLGNLIKEFNSLLVLEILLL